MKIDIVVHGRFHAFGLAIGLLELGHDVRLYTNLSARAVARFGISATRVRSFFFHGIVNRLANKFGGCVPKRISDAVLHKSFGHWAALRVRPDADIIYGFSGVMEEILRSPRRQPQQLRAVVRGSSHIYEQDRILSEEEARVGVCLERPSDWIKAREKREYDLADRIFVLSTFAYQSFLAQEVPPSRLQIIRLGVDLAKFCASKEVLAKREQRLRNGNPLRVLTVGTFSYRKGARDVALVARALSQRMEFRFVGNRLSETVPLFRESTPYIEFVDRVPEHVLPKHYEWADLFFFPTIEDGFAAVLQQAAVAGLPIIATTNCSAPDLVDDGLTGWICPIRNSDKFIDRLIWCDQNREDLVSMIRTTAQIGRAREWKIMAAELTSVLSGEH